LGGKAEFARTDCWRGCLQENAYDLILMDAHMPVMDGVEATIHIANRKRTAQHTPIIALTAMR